MQCPGHECQAKYVKKKKKQKMMVWSYSVLNLICHQKEQIVNPYM